MKYFYKENTLDLITDYTEKVVVYLCRALVVFIVLII